VKLLSVNVAEVQALAVKGGSVDTGIFKRPAGGPQLLGMLGLVGDHRVESRRQFGEENHAIHIYPYEHYAHWESWLPSPPLPLGHFGENFTTSGLLETAVRIGDIFRCGSAVLQVTQPRIPCRKLSAKLSRPSFARTFLESRRVGFYLRVLEPGVVAAGDEIFLLQSDPQSPTLDEFVRISQLDYWDVAGLERLLHATALPAGWVTTLSEKLQRARSASGWFGQRELEVTHSELAADGMVTVELRCAQRQPLPPFTSGQSLLISLAGTSAQDVVRHPCPLSGVPSRTDAYRITIPQSLADQLPIGSRPRAAAPRSSFVLAAADPNPGSDELAQT
jgi:MOSC domain-containing protein YiiM